MSYLNENYFKHRHSLGLTIDDCKRINKSCRLINSFLKKEGGLRHLYSRSYTSVLKRDKSVHIKYDGITWERQNYINYNKDLIINFFYKHFPDSIISTNKRSINVNVTPYMKFI